MNKKDDDKWLKNLRDCMEDYAEPLPEGLWEELEGELNRPKVVPFWRRWPSVAAAVALVLMICSLTLSYWLSPWVDNEDIRLANQLVLEDELTNAVSEVEVVSEEVVPEVLTENQSLVAASTVKVSRVGHTQPLAATEQPSADFRLLGAVDTEPTEESPSETTGVAVIDYKDEAATPERQPQYTSSTRSRTTSDADFAMRRKKSRDRSGLEVGVFTGGIPYNSSKQFTGMSRMASYHMLNSNEPIVMGSVNSKLTPYNRVLFSNRDKQTSTDVKHRMPINVVASVKWHFSDDWAFESGISYTYLQSELHSGSQMYWEDTQKLHYVGIPLKIHRNLWDNAHVSFYASAGGMIEKCISGSLETVYVTEKSTREVENHDVHEHPFQWSLSAAIGAQVNLIRSLSLFVEPGVAYYFDDNSQLETIRKEHPFNFNLQFGLRFGIF